MKLDDFERLWSLRDQLDEETRATLEREAKRTRHNRAFVENGSWIRDICKEMETEKAPADFAYRMRVYAKNHPEVDRPWIQRPFWKWSSVAAGLVTGAVAMILITGPIQVDWSPKMEQASIGHADEVRVEEPSQMPVPETDQASLAANADTSSSAKDSLSAQERRGPVPNWELHMVSTGD